MESQFPCQHIMEKMQGQSSLSAVESKKDAEWNKWNWEECG